VNTKAGFLLIAVVLFQAAQAQSFKLTAAESGEALLRRSSSAQKEQIKETEIGIGDTLFTLADTDARISLESQSTLLIKGGSVIVLNGKESSIDISVEEGQVFLDRNQPHELTSLRILTKGYSFTPMGTAAAIKTTRQGVPTVAVLRGSVQMLSPHGGTIFIEARQFGTVNSAGVLASGTLNEKGIGQLETWSGVKAQAAASQNVQEQGVTDSDTLNAEGLQTQSEDESLIIEQAAAMKTKTPGRGFKLGLRMGGGMNDYSVQWDYTRGMGYGAEAGFALKYVFTNRLSLNTEVNFGYRVLSKSAVKYYNYITIAGDPIFVKNDVRESITEMAVLVPVMFQITPNENNPFYLLMGAQAGVPLRHKYDYRHKIVRDDNGMFLSDKRMEFSSVRSDFDIGVVAGIGCKITSGLGVDFRYIVNVNDVYDRDKVFDGWQGRAALTNFTFGLSYFL